MAYIIVVEGARTVGKSTLAQQIRKNVFGSTLINLTGFSQDGELGKDRVFDYYAGLLLFLKGSNEIFILDRMFLSELVYSRLYKSYDFSREFETLMHDFITHNKILFLYLTADSHTFAVREKERANQSKALLFDQVADSVEETLKQHYAYNAAYNEFCDMTYDIEGLYKIKHNIVNLRVDVSEKSKEEVYTIAMKAFDVAKEHWIQK